MLLKPTALPLTAKEFDEAKVGLCMGCGCGCSYIAYLKGDRLVDLYGHPADPRGMGSLCSKGMAYVQLVNTSPFRLKGFHLRQGEEFVSVSEGDAVSFLREALKGRVAVLMDRQTASYTDYLMLRELGDIYVDAPVVDFLPSTVDFSRWKDFKFILSWEAEPVYSEVMASRWLVDGVERGAYLVCLSSIHATVCAKASEKHLLNPWKQIEFLKEPPLPIKRFLQTVPSLVLVGTSLLASPFKNSVINILYQWRKKWKVEYSLVGDLMPYPAGTLQDLFNRLEQYDTFLVLGNLLRYFPPEALDVLKSKKVITFSLFPNFSVHHSHLVISCTFWTEREFIHFRNGFGTLYRTPPVLKPPQGTFHIPYILQLITQKREEPLTDLLLEAKPIETVEEKPLPKEGILLVCDNTLVEELGRWNLWTHELDKYQKAILSPATAKVMGVRDSVEIGGVRFPVEISSNVAEGVIWISSSFEEYQPYDPGVRPGAFMKNPFFRYEVLT